MIDIPLRKASNRWKAHRDRLIKDDAWLQRKTDRVRRLGEHAEYIKTYCPEIQKSPKGRVIDIGPGPGEFLEICRHYRNKTFGIDAETGDGGMGNEYLDYSKLMVQRQNLNVEYCGLEFWLNNIFAAGTDEWREWAASCLLINSRGSIEQALSDHMEGVPHNIHHDCKKLSWKENGVTEDVFINMFAKFRRLLRPGGAVLIHANGAKNVEYYESVVQVASVSNGFRCVLREQDGVLHKWVKE